MKSVPYLRVRLLLTATLDWRGFTNDARLQSGSWSIALYLAFSALRQVKVCTHNIPCEFYLFFKFSYSRHKAEFYDWVTGCHQYTSRRSSNNFQASCYSENFGHIALVSCFDPSIGIQFYAFLGSFSASILCVIGQIAAKTVLAGRCSIFDGVVLKAVWGTAAAFSTKSMKPVFTCCFIHCRNLQRTAELYM